MKVAELQRQVQLYPPGPEKIGQQGQAAEKARQLQNGARPFADVLKDRLQSAGSPKFSAHAIRRLEERQVRVTAEEINRLNQGFRQLGEKGSKNSLILVDKTAYVVSVENKTVVTAVTDTVMQNNVFTNIDSVAIV